MKIIQRDFILIVFIIFSFQYSHESNPQESYQDNYLLYIEDDVHIKRFVSIVEKKVSKLNNDLSITQRHLKTNGSIDFDSSLVNYQSLRPTYYYASLNNGTQVEEFRFESNKIEGLLKKGKDSTFVSEQFSGVIYNAVVQDELLKNISFEKNTSYSFTIYNPGKQFLEVKYNFLGTDTVNIGGICQNALKVEMEGALLPTYIWLSQQSQKLVLQKTYLPNGDVFIKRII